MSRLLFLPGCLVLSVICWSAPDQVGQDASNKRDFPPVPEAGGLRLEVNADFSHSYGFDNSGAVWTSAFLTVEVALHNVSAEPITVPTTSFDARPHIVDGLGMERIVLRVEPEKYQGKPTAFVSARFAPVTLQPGEYVLLLRQHEAIADRKRVDALKEVSVHFTVSKAINGPKEWWRGRLVTYALISQTEAPDDEIRKTNAAMKKYDAQREAEKDPHYGVANAARVAALIASADRVSIRNDEKDRSGEVMVGDPGWIRRVSEVVGAVPLPRVTACMCTGWRTAYFQKGDQFLVSIAAIHGHQLRVYYPDGGGDYEVSEADWKAVKQALELPGETSAPPDLTPGSGQ